MDDTMTIERYMYDSFKRTEERVSQLHRALNAGMMTTDFVRLIFDWPAPEKKAEEKKPAPAPVKTIVPPPIKPLAPKKAEMMAKVKELHLQEMNGAQIARKLGLAEGTVSGYKKEMGLVGTSSMTMIEGAHGGQMQ